MTDKTKISSRGGYRPGAGAPKGAHRIHVKELKEALEKHLGKPYQEILAITHKKLFDDFMQDKNVAGYLVFTEQMTKRVVMDPIHEVNITQDNLSPDEIQDRINNLLARKALSQKATTNDTADEDGLLDSQENAESK